tara:strand:+ start:3229 stop:3744 length:516 start_codon:yes stop_codon:yes gene_type:complete
MPSIGRNLANLFGNSSTLNDNDIESAVMTVYSTIAEVPSVAENGTLVFVTANNNMYLCINNNWSKVTLSNTAPSSITGIDATYNLGTSPQSIVGIATDADETPLTWSYTLTSGSLTNGGGVTATVQQNLNVFVITPTTDPTYAGTFELTFQVTDGFANAITFVSSITCNGT